MKKSELMRIVEQYVNQSLLETVAKQGETNPLVIWASFVTTLDSAGRRMIGDDLERQGKDRYTGLVNQRLDDGIMWI